MLKKEKNKVIKAKEFYIERLLKSFVKIKNVIENFMLNESCC